MSTTELKEVFTCISCRVQFDNSDDQREHYRSELHKFNLKRKVFDLPPVTNEVFNKKVEAVKESESKQKVPTTFDCKICDKSFASEGPYTQHLNSKKHKENVAAGVPEKIRNRKPKEEKKLPESLEEAEAMMEEKIKNAVKLPLEACLFCHHTSDTIENNVEHMAKSHSFFIPDLEYLVDLPGLLRYLLDKVSIGNICLYCNGKGKTLSSKDATQTHMRDLGHCKLNYDTEADQEEYVEYYDFTPAFEGQTSDEITLFKPDIVLSDAHEITFPDGTTIGHRDFAIYYKQRYTPANKRQEWLRGIVGQYKALGYKEAPKTTMELDKKQRMRKNILELKVGMKKNTQRYYKNQLLVQ